MLAVAVPVEKADDAGLTASLRQGATKLVRRVDWALNGYAERWFERTGAVSTAGSVFPEELGFTSADNSWYQPSDWITLNRTLSDLGPVEDEVLIDIGSGMGRVLVAAARRPFRRVIGVELYRELNDQARRNLEHDRARRRCGSVEIVQADAARYELPDDVTIVHMFSPVWGDAFASLLDSIVSLAERANASVRLIYAFPVEHNLVLATGRAEPVAVAPLHWPGLSLEPSEAIVTYLVHPRAAPPPQRWRLKVGRRTADPQRWLRPNDTVFDRRGERVRGSLDSRSVSLPGR